MTTNEDIDYGEITEALNDKADRDFHNLDSSASVPYHIAVESNLQEQIDALSAKGDIADIVGTYADLTNYDKTKLSNNDIIQVLQDEEHSNSTSYYKFNSSTQTFSYVGSTAPTYTKSEIDESVVHKTGNETIDGNKIFTGVSTLSRSGDTSFIEIKNNSMEQSVNPSTAAFSHIRFKDTNNDVLGELYLRDTSTERELKLYVRDTTGEMKGNLVLGCDSNNSGYVKTDTHASSDSTTLNHIPTIGWVNDPSLSTNVVHRSGNETIAGDKTITNSLRFQYGTTTTYRGFMYKQNAGHLAVGICTSDNSSWQNYIRFNTSGAIEIVGTNVTAPTPAAGNNSTQIATTAWVNNNVPTLSNLTACHVVVQTYVSGTTWYRVWSDGWIEQGGKTGTLGNNTTSVITFPKAFSNINYNFTSCDRYDGGTSDGNNENYWISALSTTNITIYNSANGYRQIYWHACGF